MLPNDQRPRRRGRDSAPRRAVADAGMVTAETAIVLPALALTLAGVLWLVVAVGGQIRCVDAAREAARLAARGDGTSRAVAVGRRLAPPAAEVTVRRSAGDVVVTVSARVTPFGGWAGRLAALRLTATATAADEGADPAGLPLESAP